MATGYQVYCPSSGFDTYSGKWTGLITTWAWEFDTFVRVRINFYTTQNKENNKVQGSDYFNGTAVINGQSYSFRIAYLGYPGGSSSYTFEEEVDIPFDKNGKAALSFSVTVKGAKGTYLSGYSLSGTLTHTFSNEAKAGTLEMSPSTKRMGDTATLIVTGGEGTIRYKISYEFGGLTGVAAEEQMLAENASLLETTWVIPDLLEGCPDAASGILTLTCETYRFDTLIGTSQLQREISAFPAATMTKLRDLWVGGSCTFTISSPSSRYSNTIRYRLLGQEGVIVEDLTESTYIWDIPLSFGKLMPASYEETLYVYCDSYHGTALVGTNSYSTIIKVSGNERPVIDMVSLDAYIPGAPEQFQELLLQNVCKMDFHVEAHSNSSELASYTFKGFGTEITIDARDFEGFPGVAANSNAGKHRFSISVTDQRGSYGIEYYSLPIQPYSKPKVIPYSVDGVSYSTPICYRADREGMASGSGSYMRVLAGMMISDVMSGEENINSGKLEYRIRKMGEDWPEEFTELIPFGSTERFVSANLENSFPDPNASYQVELQAKDMVGMSHVYLSKVSSQKVNFSLLCAADGAAFGKTAEYPGVVEIAQDMTLWVRGSMRVDGDAWLDLEAVNTEQIWESGYAHGQRVESGCFYRTEQGSRISVAFNRTIKWLDNPITVNAVPIPQNDCPAAPVSAICAAENGFVVATVGTDGYITINLAWNAKSETQFNWVDGFIQYWKEEI